MRILNIENPILEKTFFSRVSSDYASGTALTVENNASFAGNDLIVIGESREELTESKQISSVSGSTTINLASALNFAHGKGTSIYKTPWNFVSLEQRTSSAGVFAEISQSGIQWDNPNGITIYYDSAATDAYQYRFRFYNSVLGTYSEYSPTLSGSGFTRQMVGYMIRQIRLTINDQERKLVSDDEIIRFLNRAQDIIYAANPKYWFLLVDTYKGSNGIAATATNDVYSLSTYTTLGHLSSIRYKYTTGGTNELYHLTKKADVEFDGLVSNLNQTADDWAHSYKLLPVDSSSATGYFQVFPKTLTTGVGTFYPNYYEKMSNLDSVEDETQVPLPSLLEDFAIGQIERVKGNEPKAKFYESSLVNVTENPNHTPSGIVMLNKMDQQQRVVQGQPRSLSNFKGQKSLSRLYGNRHMSRDYYKESYMD